MVVVVVVDLDGDGDVDLVNLRKIVMPRRRRQLLEGVVAVLTEMI